jgi:hypothetical protein
MGGSFHVAGREESTGIQRSVLAVFFSWLICDLQQLQRQD